MIPKALTDFFSVVKDGRAEAGEPHCQAFAWGKDGVVWSFPSLLAMLWLRSVLAHPSLCGWKEGSPNRVWAGWRAQGGPQQSLVPQGGIIFSSGDEMDAEREALCGAEGGAQGNTQHTAIPMFWFGG